MGGWSPGSQYAIARGAGLSQGLPLIPGRPRMLPQFTSAAEDWSHIRNKLRSSPLGVWVSGCQRATKASPPGVLPRRGPGPAHWLPHCVAPLGPCNKASQAWQLKQETFTVSTLEASSPRPGVGRAGSF